MQELRIVAVSEDGSYAVLAVPGRGGRFSLPIDDRLRIVARGQFSRLAQYEIEVESPLRPKEIQDRIRAGETAEEIADAAGVPIERVRRFEGPVLAERAYRAQEAQGATIRQPGDSGPGPRLGDIVTERLAELGVAAEEAQWDSRKRGDNTWQVQLMFTVGGRPQMAEWSFDPRRRHVSPADDDAARLSLPEADVAALGPSPIAPMRATVTPIGSRLSPAPPPPPVPAAEPAPAPAPQQSASWPRPARGHPARPGQPRPPPARPRPARFKLARFKLAQHHPAPPRGTAPRPARPRRRPIRPAPAWPRTRPIRGRRTGPSRPRRRPKPRSPPRRSAAGPARPQVAVPGVPRCRPGTKSCLAPRGSLTSPGDHAGRPISRAAGPAYRRPGNSARHWAGSAGRGWPPAPAAGHRPGR